MYRKQIIKVHLDKWIAAKKETAVQVNVAYIQACYL